MCCTCPPTHAQPLSLALYFSFLSVWRLLVHEPWPLTDGRSHWVRPDLIYWPLGAIKRFLRRASKLGVNSIGWLGRLGLSERLTVRMGSRWASHTACVLVRLVWCGDPLGLWDSSYILLREITPVYTILIALLLAWRTWTQIQVKWNTTMTGRARSDKRVVQQHRLISEEFIGGIILQTTLVGLNEIVNPW